MDSPTRDRPSDDDLDDILRGTMNDEDIFDTSNIEAQVQARLPKKQKPVGPDVLGLDEEIKITKKRQPIPKLDGKLLASYAGIPKLRKMSKDRLKFKGKGHEYGDIARMLNMYQFWLDGLYPRAKFADGLAIIEKLGHSKDMQRMRKEWIDEGKPKDKSDDEDEADPDLLDQPVQESVEQMEVVEVEETPHEHGEGDPQEERTQDARAGALAAVEDEPDEDELDALLAEVAVPTTSHTLTNIPSRPATTEEDMFADEDELDALLAEDAVPNTTHPLRNIPPKPATTEEDMFADEMEAIADMEHMWE